MTKLKSARKTLVWLAAFAVALGVLVLTPKAASASTTLCESPNYGYSCVDYTGYTGQPTWGYPVDSRGHNCTTYVAFRLAGNGAANPGNLGDAYYWDDSARAKGIPVNNTATVGSVAQWNFGHVAYVEKVTSTYIDTSDDSYDGTTARRRYYETDTDWPDNFIHIKDAPSGGAWGGVGDADFRGSDTLVPGQTLTSNQYTLSHDGRYVLLMQTDGNLVLYTYSGPKWASNTNGNPGAYLGIQGDNIVIYKSDHHTPLWSTGQASMGKLVIQTDGNLVAYRSGGGVAWASNTNGSTGGFSYKGDDSLDPGGRLTKGQYLRSSDRRYFTAMKPDGNFIVYAPGNRILWSAGTAGNTGAYLVVQADGNMVVYTAGASEVLWTNNRHNIDMLKIQNDGNLVARNGDGQAVWATATNGRL